MTPSTAEAGALASAGRRIDQHAEPVNQKPNQPADTKQRTTTDALDFMRFDLIQDLSAQASSYNASIAHAAYRGDQRTVEVHCKQLAAVTRELFKTVKSLGSATIEGDI